jgi:hypothetical protein
MILTKAEQKLLEHDGVLIGRTLEDLRSRIANLSVGDDMDQASRIAKCRQHVMDATHLLVAYLWGVKNATIDERGEKQ